MTGWLAKKRIRVELYSLSNSDAHFSEHDIFFNQVFWHEGYK